MDWPASHMESSRRARFSRSALIVLRRARGEARVVQGNSISAQLRARARVCASAHAQRGARWVRRRSRCGATPRTSPASRLACCTPRVVARAAQCTPSATASCARFALASLKSPRRSGVEAAAQRPRWVLCARRCGRDPAQLDPRPAAARACCSRDSPPRDRTELTAPSPLRRRRSGLHS